MKNWDKLPSVTRPGKSFYRWAEKDITVTQSFITGLWIIWGCSELSFASAKKAMKHAEKIVL